MRRRLSLIAVFSGLLMLLVPLTSRAGVAAGGFAPAGGAWGEPGPFPVAVKAEYATTFYYPRDIARSALKHPVIIWGNGTFASPPAYAALLKHWASHGFVVAAANTAFANSGNQMRQGIDRLTTLNSKTGSPFRGRVDLARIGASGHSQGGAGAVNAAADPRVSTTVPIEPGPLASPSSVRGPLLYLAGENDGIVQPQQVRDLYAGSSHVPAVFAVLAGADHFTAAGSGGGFRGVSTAWFRFFLMDDVQARGTFFGPGCAICTGTTWLDVERNAQALQIPGSAS